MTTREDAAPDEIIAVDRIGNKAVVTFADDSVTVIPGPELHRSALSRDAVLAEQDAEDDAAGPEAESA